VRAKRLHDLFGLKGSQPTLFTEAQRLLASLPSARAATETADILGGQRTVLRRVYITEEMVGFDSPRGMLVVAILRRLALTLLALFRSITRRSDERRGTPWLDLLRWFYNAVISATDDDIAALRPRALARAP
jgi:hypothetical protein